MAEEKRENVRVYVRAHEAEVMGGRGASSGVSSSGRVYGSEYTSVYQSGNIKYVRYNDSKAATAPLETRTKGRIYATLDADDQVKYISYYDNDNKRYKQIDVVGRRHKVGGEAMMPHTHLGYFHDEGGTRGVSTEEQKMVERILKTWDNRENK